MEEAFASTETANIANVEITATFKNIASKVDKILKGSLDLILSPSPSVKIQIMSGKICLRCTSKTLLGVVNKCFTLLPQVNFPTNILNFH